eukprot:2879348-Lingulodinium_polyedra.AAC.1
MKLVEAKVRPSCYPPRLTAVALAWQRAATLASQLAAMVCSFVRTVHAAGEGLAAKPLRLGTVQGLLGFVKATCRARCWSSVRVKHPSDLLKQSEPEAFWSWLKE